MVAAFATQDVGFSAEKLNLNQSLESLEMGGAEGQPKLARFNVTNGTRSADKSSG